MQQSASELRTLLNRLPAQDETQPIQQNGETAWASNKISVEILNRQFTIGTPNSERPTLLKAVELLNQKIHAIQNASRNMETEKVVIMAALNLTHDLLKLIDESNKKALSNDEYKHRITELIALCDDALKA